MRVAVILGSTNIGQAIVSRIKQDGHEVVAFSPEKPEMADSWHAVALEEPQSIKAALDQVEGPFDGVVNATDWRPHQDEAINILRSRFFSGRLFLQLMTEKLAPGASIVCTSSRSGWRWRENIEQVNLLLRLNSIEDLPKFLEDEGIDGHRAYTLANEAIIAISTEKTEGLIAKEARINSISSAAIDDVYYADYMRQLGPKAQENVNKVKRKGQPEEVAELINWLLGPQSSWVNGENITVDGGIGAILSTKRLRIGQAPEKPQSFLRIATSWSVVRRSLSIAAIVGCILAILNHGDRIFAGDIDMTMLAKICLTFFVPFCVSTYSSFLAVRGNLQRIAPPL